MASHLRTDSIIQINASAAPPASLRRHLAADRTLVFQPIPLVPSQVGSRVHKSMQYGRCATPVRRRRSWSPRRAVSGLPWAVRFTPRNHASYMRRQEVA